MMCNQGIQDPADRFYYRFAPSDQQLYADINNYFAMHPEVLPADADDYCSAESAPGVPVRPPLWWRMQGKVVQINPSCADE